MDDFLLIGVRNKRTQGVAHNYIMSATQMSFKWNGPWTSGGTFSYFTTQQWDRLQFILGTELISLKPHKLLPSASYNVVYKISISNYITQISTVLGELLVIFGI